MNIPPMRIYIPLKYRWNIFKNWPIIRSQSNTWHIKRISMNIFWRQRRLFLNGLDISNKNRDIKDNCSILILELAGWMFMPWDCKYRTENWYGVGAGLGLIEIKISMLIKLHWRYLLGIKKMKMANRPFWREFKFNI